MAIGRNNTTLNINDVVATLLLEEISQKTMEGSNPKALLVRGRSVSKKKGKPSSGRSKLKLRLMSLGHSTRRYWTCGNPSHYKKYCKSKGVSTSKDS